MTATANQRVIESRQRLKDLPPDAIAQLSVCLLKELGDPPTELEEEALRSLQSGDYDTF